MAKPLDILEVVNGSGFPLQMAVTDFVRRTKARHECRVLFTEHSWKDSVGEYGGFIDLVALKPFFELIYDRCGIERSPHLDEILKQAVAIIR
jgi:hypothetical protein